MARKRVPEIMKVKILDPCSFARGGKSLDYSLIGFAIRIMENVRAAYMAGNGC